MCYIMGFVNYRVYRSTVFFSTIIMILSRLHLFFVLLVFYFLKTGSATGTCNTDDMQEILRDALDKTTKETVKLMIDAANNLPKDDYENLGLIPAKPAESCKQLYELNSSLPSDEYWIGPSSDPVKVYCAMNLESCGDKTGGWMRVADLDMTRPNDVCPAGLTLYTQTSHPRRLCGIDPQIQMSYCAGVKYSLSVNISYNVTCGKIRGYQYDNPVAFHRAYDYGPDSLSHVYIYGVSVTYSSSPRKHIWTLAGAPDDTLSNGEFKCECIRPENRIHQTSPYYVGNDYFCDTALRGISYANAGKGLRGFYNPLWDGEGCSSTNACCDFPGGNVKPPWFYKELPESTTSYLEVRVCHPDMSGSTPLEKIELYVQ